MLVLTVRGGVQVCVPFLLNQITPYVLLEQEDWFEDEIRFVRKWLRPGMRVVDVGANYGVYTLSAAQAVGASGAVWAFEPTPECRRFLERSLSLNAASQVTLSPLAISDSAGEVPFLLTRSPEENSIAAAASSAGAVRLPASSLDVVAEQCGWGEIDFLKLDVEGHELQAVRGGRAFLGSRSPLVMLEVRAAAKFDFSAARLLVGMGYQLYRLLPGPLVLVPLAEDEAADESLLNVFACKPDRAERLAAQGLLGDPHAARLGAPAAGAWAAHVASIPYAAQFARTWRSRPGIFAGAVDKAYFEGLAAYASFRDETLGAAERCAWLARSFECVGRAVEDGGTLARQISYARIAWDLGKRRISLDWLGLAIQRVEQEWGQVLREPFLCPMARYESVSAAPSAGDWLRCALVEQLEKTRAFSSLYVRDTTPEILGYIMESPYRSPEMDRRWQLVRMASGQQAGPQAMPSLCSRSDENLNPEFWCRATR
jgi:FkbM family methyltransferase